MKLIRLVFLCSVVLLSVLDRADAQDSSSFQWNVSSKRIAPGEYTLSFSTTARSAWQLYAPNQKISGVPAAELLFADSSSVVADSIYTEKGASTIINSKIFDNAPFKIYEATVEFTVRVKIKGNVPAQLNGTFKYTYGKQDEFYSLTPFAFSVPLEGGITATARIKINSIDLKNPIRNCGDEGTEGKGLGSIFLLGLIGGFIALLTPCVFPLIPLTVSFFTKRAASRKKGIAQAMLYGFFIFFIYVLLSIPFYLLDANPEILNNISTNVWLNLFFFVIFVVFAISFFGYFEITLPGSVANKADQKAGVGNIAGIFFMALTLAIVSFSCTGPILGSLLAGALTKNGGAIQLSFGMGGFGLGLAMPFAVFALFPNLLHSLPKSGGWLNSVKVVLGFLELAMAVKFLSNADLVEQWGIVKRELFLGFWIIIGLLIILYLIGKIRFPHDSPVTKFSKARIAFIVIFGAFTAYLLPGVTNTPSANLRLISGFPPPLCYSLFSNPVNCEKGVEPLKNDYELALQEAKKQHKPLLIDFTGWACVNCRRMEENVWTDPDVKKMMTNDFVVVSLYVDDRRVLPAIEQSTFLTKNGIRKQLTTVGDKWATFQSENFNAVSQPQYAIISDDERMITKTKFYTPAPKEFAQWLQCGLDANKGSPK